MDSPMLLSVLPDLAPRDSHSLWYISPRNPISSYVAHRDISDATQGQNPRRNQHIVDRSPLARLRADELNIERRQHNVANFGSTWLKPPGLPKSLHQIREERREQEEHQEAMRREALAQELAEAEVAGAQAAEDLMNAEGDDGMDDVQLDGARDLDEDIPEAADADFSDASYEDSDTSDVDPDLDSDDEDTEQRAVLEQQQQLMAQRMRQADDPFLETVSHIGDGTGFYDGVDEVDAEDQAEMIEEGDVIGDGDGELDMDADLDDDIPEAESAGGYEHTDSEAELSSSDDDQEETSFAATRAPHTSRFRGSLARTDRTRASMNSIAMSDLLSRDGSSLIDSSPQIPRQSIGGSLRHSLNQAYGRGRP